MHPPSCEYFGSRETAAALGITPNGVRDRVRRGTLRAERVGGRWRFSATDIAKHVAKAKE